MHSLSTATEIIEHLGGDSMLHRIGAFDLVAEDRQLSFILRHSTAKGAHSVLISAEPGRFFTVSCFGRIQAGTFHAPLIGRAIQVVPDSLAARLGELAGIAELEHLRL